MISQKINDAFNNQIQEEVFSSYLYLSMSAWFDGNNLPGYASWMRMQAQEEMVHAMKFYNHIIDRSGKVKLLAIEAPQSEWASPLAAFEDAYKHEGHITDCINKLVALARETNDNAALKLLDWFVTEQVEEEKAADEQAQSLKMIQDNGHGLLMLDREAGARVFALPTPSAT